MGSCPFFHDKLLLSSVHKIWDVTSLFLAGFHSNFTDLFKSFEFYNADNLTFWFWFAFFCDHHFYMYLAFQIPISVGFYIIVFTSVPIWLYPWPVFWSEILFIEGSILANVYPRKR